MKNKSASGLISLKLFVACTLLTFFSSCVSSRLLKEDEYLYSGAEIKVHADKNVSGRNSVKGLLKEETYPVPNRRVLGIPYKLWIYSIFKSKRDKSFVGNTYGERPVLMTDVAVDEVAQSLQTVLKANGFLDSRVKPEVVDTKLGKQQRKVLYHTYVREPYQIRKIAVEIEDTAIAYYIDSTRKESLIRPNSLYNLVKLRSERERIDGLLKSKGYYYFSPDFLYYFADSTVGKRQIDIFLRLKSGLQPGDLKPWFVNDVFVFDNSVRDSLTMEDTVRYKDVAFLTGKLFKPKYLRHFILFGKGDLLTTEKYKITNKNLSSLTAFKFANMSGIRDTVMNNRVNLVVEITPNTLHNFKAEANLVSKSNDFAGPGIELGYTHRNLLRGGEQLNIKVNGNIEGWLSKSDKEVIGNFNYEFGASAELKFPRFLLINPNVVSSKYIPDNHIRIDWRYITQMQFYKMNFFRLLYGYRWAESEYIKHELNIIDITFQHRLRSTFDFDSLMNVNPLLEQSFSDQFMVGTNYTYQYSVPDSDPRIFRTAFTGALDLSGNLLYGIQRVLGKKSTEEEPLRFLGTRYAQYVKVTLDYRMFFDVSKKNRIATRISTGAGLPIGNSGSLPGIKQYFLGGANSIRAFKFRSVGPGAYGDPSLSDAVLINHSGELMLLGNIENRYKLSRSFEWALFLDAGNIWLAKEDPLRTGAQFKSDSFLKQLAVGWGTGLRYINQFFIIRVDVGFPLHSPNAIQKASDMNTVWNFAIGYPF